MCTTEVHEVLLDWAALSGAVGEVDAVVVRTMVPPERSAWASAGESWAVRNPMWVGGAAPASPTHAMRSVAIPTPSATRTFRGSALGFQVPALIRAHRRPSAPWRTGSTMNFQERAATPMLAAT